MATTSLQYDKWRRGLAYQAEVLRQSIAEKSPQDAFREIEAIVKGSEVVMGFWPDEAEPDGFGTYVVKGQNLLADIASGRRGKNAGVRFAAVPCLSFEHAKAASRVWGGQH